MSNSPFNRTTPNRTSVQRYVPLTGATLTVARAKDAVLLIDPAGTLATLTVALPTTYLENGDTVTIATSQIITALTLTGTIVGTLTTLALGGFAKFQYSLPAAKWFRVG